MFGFNLALKTQQPPPTSPTAYSSSVSLTKYIPQTYKRTCIVEKMSLLQDQMTFVLTGMFRWITAKNVNHNLEVAFQYF